MIYPLGKRMLVEQEIPREKTEGGIVLPDTAQRQTGRGTVLEVGAECHLKKGDRILFAKYVGTKIELAGDSPREYELGKHMVINEEDVLGIEREEVQH
jgi:chaperonin GroES